MQRLSNFIDGTLRPPESGSWIESVDPAIGEPYCLVPDSNAADVQQAVDAAESAFPDWSATPAARRSRIILDIADRIEGSLEAFARAESIDAGKPIDVARTVDIPRAVANLRFFATAILHTRSEAHPTDLEAINYTLRRPRGIAGLISPWNLPLYLLTWKIAPAIATGNTAVAKPSELTPMTAFMLAQTCIDAGLPPGVLNIVHGVGPVAGDALCRHPSVGTLSFTGGTATGAAIASVAAPMFKKVALEMGGKNPNIVFADANLDDAVATSVRAAFSNQGQICLCGSRIFVERSIYPEFLRRFVETTGRLRQGDPLEPGTQQGALVSRAHLEKVLGYIELARNEGATVACGGSIPKELPERVRGGYFLKPTVLTGLPADCRVNREEIFGPVVSVTPFENEDEVVGWANGTDYGLAASIWTSDITRAHRMAERIACGTIWINCWMIRDLRVPFGGMKHSGLGREGGEEALRFFTEPKNVCIRLSGLG